MRTFKKLSKSLYNTEINEKLNTPYSTRPKPSNSLVQIYDQNKIPKPQIVKGQNKTISTNISLRKRPLNYKDLICPNCINTEIIDDNACRKKALSNGKNKECFHFFEDKNKCLSQKIINEKIASRAKTSQITYDKLNMFRSGTQKEKLQLDFENSLKNDFFSTNKDYSRDRALSKQLKTENNIINKNKFTIQNDNPRLVRYYERCVGDGNTNIFTNKATPRLIWSNYYKDLQQQINDKKEEQKEKKLKEAQEENKIIQEQNEKYKEMYRTQYIAKRKLQKDFQEVNEKLVEDKKQKQKDDKFKQIKLEKEFIQNEQQINRNLDNKNKKRKEELNNVCKENLKISLENRKRRQEFKNEENNKIYNGFHLHENKLGRCGKCNKAVPPNVLAKSPFHNRVTLNQNKNLKY